MTGSILVRDALLKRCGVSPLRVNKIGEAAHIVVSEGLGDCRHAFVAAPALAKQKQLRDGVQRRLAGKHRRQRHVASPIRTMTASAQRREALCVAAGCGAAGAGGAADIGRCSAGFLRFSLPTGMGR